MGIFAHLEDVDFARAFADVIAIAQSAPTATAGWRAICVRERRRLGAELIAPLTALDLDDDAAAVARVVRDLLATSRGADSTDMLFFGLFDAIDDGSEANAGYHVAAAAALGRAVEEVMRDPWELERRFLRSDTLDTIVRVAESAPRPARPLLEYSLSFGAAALTSRFATRGLAHRVVVRFDDDHGRPPPAGAPRWAEIS